MHCRPRHRRKSSSPSAVAYRNRPATFNVSWFPFITTSSPPASRASFLSRSRRRRIATSSPPRSSWSPTCTAVVVPPDHRSVEGSMRPPATSASFVFARSPCRSPTATSLRTAGRNTGPGAPGDRSACVSLAAAFGTFSSPLGVRTSARRQEKRDSADVARGGGGCTAAPFACSVSTNASTNGPHTGASAAHRGSASSGLLPPTPIVDARIPSRRRRQPRARREI
eukprot:6880-Pelagococcus_subviridis.AAC.1